MGPALVRSCPFLVTGLSLSPDGNHLLSNSMDSNVFMWDLRPFSNENRLEKTFYGIKVTFRVSYHSQEVQLRDILRSREDQAGEGGRAISGFFHSF